MRILPPVYLHPLEITFAHINLQLLLNSSWLAEANVTMMRNGWFKISGEFSDTLVMVAVQQHATFLEFIPVPILRGLLRPGEPRTQPGTGCHTQRVMLFLLSLPLKPAALERARAPGQQCESRAGPKRTNTNCCKCVCTPLVYPPSSFRRVLFSSVHAKRSLEEHGDPAGPSPAKTTLPPCTVHQLRLQCAFIPQSKEAEGTLCPQERSPLFHPAVTILCAGTWTLTTRTSQLSYFKLGLGLIKCSLISTWKGWRNMKPAHLYW